MIIVHNWTRSKGLTWTVMWSVITSATFQSMTDWRVTTSIFTIVLIFQDPQQSSSQRWVCHVCTYINLPLDNICTMCAKSRQYGLSPRLESESGGYRTLETINGNEELDEQSFLEHVNGIDICSNSTFQNLVRYIVGCQCLLPTKV